MSNLTASGGRRTTTAVIGSLAAATLVLTACSDGGGEGDAAAERVTQEQIDEAMSTPTKLVFWTWVPDIQNQIDLFEAEYPAIDVELVNVGQGADHYLKLRSALQAGEGAPDVAQIEFQHIESFALGDNLLDLTPYLPEDAGDDYVEWVWDQVRSTDGTKVWGVPQDSGPVGILYRDDILSDNGIEVPTTWDEFADAARALHQADPSTYLTNMPGNDPGQWVSLMWQAGARPFGWDGEETVTIDVNGDESRQVAQYWQDLIQDGVVSVDADFNDSWYQALSNGKYTSWVPAAAWGPVFLQGTAGNTSGLWRAAPAPQWEAGQDPTSSNWGGSSDAVLRSTANPIAAAQLAYWINHAEKGDLVAALDVWQADLVEYAEQQGFTVR